MARCLVKHRDNFILPFLTSLSYFIILITFGEEKY
jgi:hypothetical protein